MTVLDLIDGLRDRDLLDRVQIVQCEGASIQLGPKPFTPPVLTPEEQVRQDAKRADPLPDPDALLFGASEGT